MDIPAASKGHRNGMKMKMEKVNMLFVLYRFPMGYNVFALFVMARADGGTLHATDK